MLNKRVKIYISIIIALGLSFIIYSILNIPINRIVDIILFVFFAALAESMPIYVTKELAVSVAFAIDLMAILIFGPYQGALIASLGMTFRFPKYPDGRRVHIFNLPYYKVLFNASQLALSVGIGGLAYEYTGGIPATYIYPRYLLSAVLAAIVYYLLNTFIVAILLSLLLNKSFKYILTKDFKWMIPNFLFLAFLGIIMSEAFIRIGYISFILLFIPLLMIRYMFKLYMDSKQSYYDTINVLVKALDAKDKYTAGHSKNVEKIAALLCREFGLSESQTEMVRIAALLHDIGKIGVKEEVLNKPGKLTDEELSIIKEHPQKGYEILRDVPALKEASLWVKYHHEWYDGSGYPDGIKGDEIPLEAQILSLADVFDALVSDRPYRKAFSQEEAYKIILEHERTQFSPKIINAFKKAFEKNREEFKHDI
ncbi:MULTISPECIES: HD-GYP domain-containing protein [Thermoanaerobacter]|uniref:Metal dependent phosphohydrolase n=2 Tax=Thermoanaerobacter TaxID=1754 RepID=B0KBV2_THEP3|nr:MULTISPECIES: HD-GYP domain-containing protein [Thermoanaerobacter]ABY95397.1 metal dependent phosphohydrolase [Thermoanaerobacter pseudethanolicus ATCC 33223]ADV80340.1 metal dependent phosphohydrolase [Thermoanaerobacter brockii subsp. finnii Ako-1]HBW59716.1 HD-GYP domain-containing protein [Thermoanaerobacter sp.]